MRRLIIVAALALLTALPAMAQQPAAAGIRRSNTSKLLLEVAANGSGVSLDDFSDGTESGAGLTLRVGYGFTPKFAGVIDITSAEIQDDFEGYTLTQADIGIRYHFANASRAFVPYLETAASVFIMWQENVAFENDQGESVTGDLDISGTGFTLGGGLLYFFSQKWALSGGFKWTKGSFDEVTLGNVTVSGLDLNATTTRFNLGVAWFPMLPR